MSSVAANERRDIIIAKLMARKKRVNYISEVPATRAAPVRCVVCECVCDDGTPPRDYRNAFASSSKAA